MGRAKGPPEAGDDHQTDAKAYSDAVSALLVASYSSLLAARYNINTLGPALTWTAIACADSPRLQGGPGSMKPLRGGRDTPMLNAPRLDRRVESRVASPVAAYPS
jgi:hypothetical protein